MKLKFYNTRSHRSVEVKPEEINIYRTRELHRDNVLSIAVHGKAAIPLSHTRDNMMKQDIIVNHHRNVWERKFKALA